jgi:type VI secretion system protein ImpH
MAAESGEENLAVIPAVPPSARLAEVERELHEIPGRFNFFQAVRLLLRIYSDRAPVGQFAHPAREALRFGANNSLAFPPSQIHSIQWEEAAPRMLVNFMGLTGPNGVLPYSYTNLISARLREKDRTLLAFFDMFNHRIISLFYQAWEKYRSSVAYERDGKDRLSQYLMCLIGMGTAGLQGRLAVRDETLLYYSGLLALQPRSATALRQILSSYFSVPADVEEFIGVWRSLDPSNQCEFKNGDSFSEQLGVGAVVGDEIWDQQSRVRVKLGPLTQEQYLAFLPAGNDYDALRAMTRFFCSAELEVEVQLILRRDQVPRCDLGKSVLSGPRLGWFTWMKSGAEFDRAPSDTVLLLV